METTKPRYSVLHMFDPLGSPCTPPSRDHSPDSGSDKENDVQPGEVTVFFTRTYTQKHPPPKTPKGRLIDIGDTTMGDPWGVARDSDGNASEDESLENGSTTEERLLDESFNLEEDFAHSLVGRRIPLAEIKLEETPRPRENRIGLSVLHEEHLENTLSASTITRAPSCSPLSEVINSINLRAMTISTSERPSPLATRCVTRREEIEEEVFPHIVVSSLSPSETATQPSPECTTQRPSTSSIAPRRRPCTANHVPLDDPRRCSVDLQSSFRLQMQSDDMSFDLLNDKVSFLGQGPDSFWTGADDENIDWEAEEATMEAVVRVCERIEEEKEEEKRENTDSIEEVRVKEEEKEEEKAGKEKTKGNLVEIALSQMDAVESVDKEMPQVIASVIYPVESMPLGTDESSKQADNAPAEQASEQKSVNKADISSRLTLQLAARPAPLLLPAEAADPTPAPLLFASSVPALRIVKKTWKVHGRTDSSASASSSASSTSSASAGTCSGSHTVASARNTNGQQNKPVSTVSSSDGPQATSVQPAVAALYFSRAPSRAASVRNVQRPEVSAGGSSKTTAPSFSDHEPVQQQAVVHGTSRPSLEAAAREAARRFAAAGIQRPNIQQGERPMPSTQMTGAQGHVDAVKYQKFFAPLSGAAVGGAKAKRPQAASLFRFGGIGSSGLRPPSRFGGAGVKAGTASALPRASSRLPAPVSRGMSGSIPAIPRREVQPGNGARAMGGTGIAGLKRTL